MSVYIFPPGDPFFRGAGAGHIRALVGNGQSSGHFRIWFVDAASNESTLWVNIYVELSVGGNTCLASNARIAILSETPIHLRIQFLLQPACLFFQG